MLLKYIALGIVVLYALGCIGIILDALGSSTYHNTYSVLHTRLIEYVNTYTDATMDTIHTCPRTMKPDEALACIQTSVKKCFNENDKKFLYKTNPDFDNYLSQLIVRRMRKIIPLPASMFDKK